MYTITKKFSFEASHRLLGHPKCGRSHGHSYKVIVQLQAQEISGNGGMVRDYGDLKDIKDFIDTSLDHKYLVSDELIDARDPYYTFGPPEDMSVLPIPRTTAEYLAQYFFTIFKEWFPEVSAVTVCETEGTTAEYRP